MSNEDCDVWNIRKRTEKIKYSDEMTLIIEFLQPNLKNKRVGNALGAKDKKGRFLKYKNPSDEVEKIRAAFIAGINGRGHVEVRPSVLADRYMKQQGYL